MYEHQEIGGFGTRLQTYAGQQQAPSSQVIGEGDFRLGDVVPYPAVQSGSPGTRAHVYRPRRPEKTLLHKTVRQSLETYLVANDEQDDFRVRVPLHVEAAFRGYLKCGLLCHGFVRHVPPSAW